MLLQKITKISLQKDLEWNRNSVRGLKREFLGMVVHTAWSTL